MLLYEGWILTLGVGLGFLAFVRVFLWQRVRRSFLLRLPVCVVLSCCFAPSFFLFGGGDHFGGVAVWPATLMLALVFCGEMSADLFSVGTPLLSIFITSAVLLGLWSRALAKKRETQTAL